MKRRLIRFLLLLIGLLTALILVGVVAYRLANRTNGVLISSGEERAYLLYVPERYDPATATPLVITFHGFVQWPAQQMQLSGWNELADQYGFIVVYPSGTGFPLRWRTGGPSGGDGGPAPDVTFTSDLIDQLHADYNVDPTRIYANGMSNGAGMTFVLTCELSDRIAAAGLVAGAYVYRWDQCQLGRPVPAVVFHGTADPIVPFEGGRMNRFDVAFPSIPQWVETLARRNGCDEIPGNLRATGDVSGVQFANCDASVVFYTISGGGHTWPGGEPLPRRLTGDTTQELSATQVMWDFFLQHPLPAQ